MTARRSSCSFASKHVSTTIKELFSVRSMPKCYKQNNYMNLALLFGGVSQIGTIKYAHESRGTELWEMLRWRWPAKKLETTDPTSRQRGRPTSTNRQLSKNNEREKGRNWSLVPDGCLTPRQTGRLTVGRSITLTLWLLSEYLSCVEAC
jgi:hypothetical protein